MKLSMKLAQAILLLSLCITKNSVAAQSIPASVEYVNQAIATAIATIKTYVNQAMTTATTLTQADWQAICQTGDINSPNGCYGDAGSQAFAKINRLGSNPLGYAGVTGSAANSVWLRQIGVGTSCTTTNAQLAVLNTAGGANSTIWICGVELTNGSPVSSAYSLGALINNAAYTPSNSSAGILFSTIGIGNMLGGRTTPVTSNELYFADSPVLPTAYLFCISTTNTSVATAFAQAPAASFNDIQC